MAFSPHDVVPDSPINNFATLNPLQTVGGGASSFSNGNLSCEGGFAFSNFSMNSGKWYFETVTNIQTSTIGIFRSSINATQPVYTTNLNYRWYRVDGKIYSNNGTILSYNTFTSNDIIGITLDLDNGKLFFSKNGIWEGLSDPVAGTNPAVIGLTGEWMFSVEHYVGQDVCVTNFGQDHTFGGNKTGGGAYTDANGIGQFYYQPPAGALALCTQNIPSGPINVQNDDVPADYFKAVTWTGGQLTNNQVTGVGFQPDLIWSKQRNGIGYHRIHDSVRGASAGQIITNTAAAQNPSYPLGSFDSDGFTISSTLASYDNTTNNTYVAWCWKAAGAPADNQARIIDINGTLITKSTADLKNETSASVTPTKVSANRKSGFSIIQWSGNNTAGATYPHGLSQAPEFMITKNINNSPLGYTLNWLVWHSSINQTGYLNLPDAFASGSRNTVFINDTLPSVDLITTGYQAGVTNDSGLNQITYCWHSVAGYSKFGSYVGNGSADGPFIYTGFKPAWVLIKQSHAPSQSWFIYDTSRDPSNPAYHQLFANQSVADPESFGYIIDILSNGFKIRNNDQRLNSSVNYIFAAFAEAPMNAPSNAR
jgi:hypothetical protein